MGRVRAAMRRATGATVLAVTLGATVLPLGAATAVAAERATLSDASGWSAQAWGGAGSDPYAGQGWGGTEGWGYGEGQAGSGGVDSGSGEQGGYGQGGYGQGGSAASGTTTVDSDPATDAESAGVVLIDTTLDGGTGAGTGIVVSADGQVLTNYHVVESATSITVTIASTGRTYTAEVVGHGTSTDLAVLQLQDASGLTTATLDDDADLAVGDDVTAVGNAGGTGTLTAADGTVTRLSTTITTSDEGSIEGETLKGVIETSADVVPGDSGGPLLDADGEVVGIDTAASSGTTSATIEGYAIPIADALSVVKQIRQGETTDTVQVGASGFLGVQVTDAGRGASVAAVLEGSPAEQAGLAAGDTITAVGGTAVDSAKALVDTLSGHAEGDRVTLHWTDADDDAHRAAVTLAASPTA